MMKTSPLLAPLLSASIALLRADEVPKFDRSVPGRENMEASIPRPEQDKAADEKLASLEKRTGRKPNILWLVVDE